jgi:hypothetical protein
VPSAYLLRTSILAVAISAVYAGPRAEAVAIRVPAGGDLQVAIDRARPGDAIMLDPGATYVGNFTLPPTAGSDYITIRSAADASQFPSDGRVRPEHVQWMPTLRSPNGAPALATKPSAHHWRLQWLAFAANADGVGDVITLGDGSDAQRDLTTIPHHFVLDGLIIRGDKTKGQKRAIALNSGSTSVRNSDIRDIKAAGQDSQAICGWNGPGPFLIENNYLEAAGENILFGGSDPFVPDLVPSDITIRGNYVTKPLEWRQAGLPWTVKNLLELKNASRVLIERNIFENVWLAGQTGYAILLTPANQDGRAPWTLVSDVTLQSNLIRHVSSGINILGYDYAHTSRQTRNIQVRQNLFYDVDGATWGGDGRFLLIGDEPTDIVVDHNTVIQSGTVLLLYGKKDGRIRQINNLRLTNNLMRHNEYGIIGDDTGMGQAAITAYTSNAEIRRNVMAGGNASNYPADNFFPSLQEFLSQFVDSSKADYRLLPSSRFRNGATDGSMIGADVDALRRRLPAGTPTDQVVPRRQ